MIRRGALALSVALLLSAPGGAGAADGDPRYTVEEGVRLPARMEAHVRAIAAEFFRRTGRRLHVTSGTRSPRAQAEAMYVKLRLGQRLTRLYRDTASAIEITRAYRRHRRRGRADAVRAMARVIRRQVRAGRCISRHLGGEAVDVRSRDLSRRHRRIFERIVARRPGLRLLAEGRPPHFHVQLSD